MPTAMTVKLRKVARIVARNYLNFNNFLVWRNALAIRILTAIIDRRKDKSRVQASQKNSVVMLQL